MTIDGAATEFMEPADLIAMLLGPPNSIAELLVVRSGRRPETMKIRRQVLHVTPWTLHDHDACDAALRVHCMIFTPSKKKNPIGPVVLFSQSVSILLLQTVVIKLLLPFEFQ